jgi:hypothetical protein
MPTFITGLPLHVLVVHAVVVLLPLSAVGAVVVAAWPRARRRWGWPVVIAAAVAVVAIPVATQSGEGLEHNLPRTDAIEVHTHLGDELLPYAAGMLVALLALMLVHLQRRRQEVRSARPGGPGAMVGPQLAAGPARVLTIGLAAVTVVLAVVSVVQVVRIGDSGARAAWGSVQYVPQAPGGERD